MDGIWLWDKAASIWRKALCDADGKLIISDADPFEVIQDTPEDLKHLPHAQVTGDGVYKPLQLDANDYLMVAIKALEHLNDITDVNVAAPTDGYVLYWDAGAGEFKLKVAYTSVLTTLGDILRRGAAADERLPIGAASQVLTVVAGEPAWGAAPTVTSSGTYVGDDTVNRAIPHGLGVTPKIVFITNADSAWFRLYDGLARILYNIAAATTYLTVTAPGAINFYVGNATSYINSANQNAVTQYWVAIG